MSTPTGFMEYKRQLPGDRDPEQRVKDWEEFHHHLSEDELRTQGARCMDCGTPIAIQVLIWLAGPQVVQYTI